MGIYSGKPFEELLARPFDNRPRPAGISWNGLLDLGTLRWRHRLEQAL
jgi:hypothetical protein